MSEPKNKKVQLWCTDEQVGRIDEAARILGLNRSSFMLMAALEKARSLSLDSSTEE